MNNERLLTDEEMADERAERRKMVKVFGYTEKELYEYMRKEGEKRFGSECKHKRIKNGYCLDCLRKVR